MKFNLLFLLLLLAQFLSAQTFTAVPQPTLFDGVTLGSIAFADVDGDNDQDILITGENSSGVEISKLYTNDGGGTFTEMMGTPFDGVSGSSIAFADVDGDNDQDILITGENSSGVEISKLYTNDGGGTFTEMMGTPFDGVENSSIAFADVDGDNDQDVLITGRNGLGVRISKLYTNDGGGTFTEMMGTPFDGVSGSSITFADVDGDNDQDVLITGFTSSFTSISKLYTNDGAGNFTEMMGTPFDGVSESSIAFADVDGDNDQDVLITGGNNSGDLISKLYTNDGTGNFTEMMGTPFDGVSGSSIAFADVDGDNDQDVLITGNNSGDLISKLYTNDGGGTFTEMMDTPFDGVDFSSIAFTDVDGDNDQDVLITGSGLFSLSIVPITKLYTNNGGGTFAEIMGTPFDDVDGSSIAFADVDGDNDLDVLITGQNNSFAPITKLYTNDGGGTFTQMMGTPFEGVGFSSIAFADVDGDNDQDVLITGQNSSEDPITKLYTNDGGGTFTEMMGTPFDNVYRSSIAFADVDGDNDQDVLITGENSSEDPISKLYTNDGGGTFTEMMGTPFDGVFDSSIAFADVDGDNDQDVLLTGRNSSFAGISKLYTNDGGGTFTEIMSSPFEDVYWSSIAFADVDGDNDEDILITGFNLGLDISKLYTNDGGGTFTEMMGTPFEGVVQSSIAFADVDGDNDQDVLLTGRINSFTSISKLYTNDGAGNFTEMMGTPFEGVGFSSIAFADVDGDNDPDVLLTGRNSAGDPISKLYTNDGVVSSTDDLKTGLDLKFILYPNPSTSSTLFVNYNSAEAGAVVLNIYDLNGFLLKRQHEFSVIGEQTFSVDVTSLIKGYYFIELENGKNRGIAKFILQ